MGPVSPPVWSPVPHTESKGPVTTWKPVQSQVEGLCPQCRMALESLEETSAPAEQRAEVRGWPAQGRWDMPVWGGSVTAAPPAGFSVDWWALGVLMFEMMAGRSPFDIITDNPDMNTEDYLFQGDAVAGRVPGRSLPLEPSMPSRMGRASRRQGHTAVSCHQGSACPGVAQTLPPRPGVSWKPGGGSPGGGGEGGAV